MVYIIIKKNIKNLKRNYCKNKNICIIIYNDNLF